MFRPRRNTSRKRGARKTAGELEQLRMLLGEVDASIRNPYHMFEFSVWPRCRGSSVVSSTTYGNGSTDLEETKSDESPDRRYDRPDVIAEDRGMCPSLRRWELLAFERTAKKRKTAKVAKRQAEQGPPSHPWIKRPKGVECPCDHNPHCLASVGVIADSLINHEAEHTSSDAKTSVATVNGVGLRKTILVKLIMIKNHLQIYVQSGKSVPQAKQSLNELLSLIRDLHLSIMSECPKNKTSEMSCNSIPQQITVSVPPGMKNLGATCYLSSQLQCLALNPVFRRGVFSWRPESSKVSSSNSNAERMRTALTHLQTLLSRMVFGGMDVVCSSDFAKALGLVEDEMQDPNEFARLLFDRMHESFQLGTYNSLRHNESSSSPSLNELLPSIFRGKCEYVTVCSECGYSSTRSENFTELTLPIAELFCQPKASNNGKHSKGNAVDTDVQHCLLEYLSPELLTGDNKYMCAGCMKKCDATRTIHLSKIPPVLNVQLSRYVFDMSLLMKKKLLTRVRLPRILRIPTVCLRGDEEISTRYQTSTQENDAFATDSSAEFVLCGVLNHQGTSAYGGHYIAEAMDWTTGMWFEFNDEEVKFIESGPKCSFFGSRANDKKGDCSDRPLSILECMPPPRDPGFSEESQKQDQGDDVMITGEVVRGSEDAYSLFYVQRSYLAKEALKEIVMSKGLNNVYSSSRHHMIEERREHERLLDCLRREDQAYNDLLSSLRRGIANLFSTKFHDPLTLAPDSLCDVSNWTPEDKDEEVYWVDTSTLREFLRFPFVSGNNKDQSATDLRKLAASFLHQKRALCEHSIGLHPRVFRRGKLLRRNTFERMKELFYSNLSGSKSSSLPEEHAIILKSNTICGFCADAYSLELRSKAEVLRKVTFLKDVLDPVHGEEKDEGTEGNWFYLSKKFISDFRRLAGKKIKSVLSTLSEDRCAAATLDSCSFEGLVEAPEIVEIGSKCKPTNIDSNEGEDPKVPKCSDGVKDTSEKSELDFLVNTKIACSHGAVSLNACNRRSIKVVSQCTWGMILALYPHALEMRAALASDAGEGERVPRKIVACEICRAEKDAGDTRKLAVKQWAAETLEKADCRELFQKRSCGFPPLLSREDFHTGKVADQTENFHLVDSSSVDLWRGLLDRAKKVGCLELGDKERLQDVKENCAASSPCQCICSHNCSILPSHLVLALQGAFVGDLNDVQTKMTWTNAPCELVTESELGSLVLSLSALRQLELSPLEASSCARVQKTINSVVCINPLQASFEQAELMNCGEVEVQTLASDRELLQKRYHFSPSLCAVCSFGEDNAPQMQDEKTSQSTLDCDTADEWLLVVRELQHNDEIPESTTQSSIVSFLTNGKAQGLGTRKSTRKKGNRGKGKRHELQIRGSDTLAKLRLLLLEQFGLTPVGQELVMSTKATVLPFQCNREKLKALNVVNGETIFVRYPRGDQEYVRLKRITAQERREQQVIKEDWENAMVEALLEADAAGSRIYTEDRETSNGSDQNWKAERGFYGTLLQSNSTTCGATKRSGKIVEKSGCTENNQVTPAFVCDVNDRDETGAVVMVESPSYEKLAMANQNGKKNRSLEEPDVMRKQTEGIVRVDVSIIDSTRPKTDSITIHEEKKEPSDSRDYQPTKPHFDTATKSEQCSATVVMCCTEDEELQVDES